MPISTTDGFQSMFRLPEPSSVVLIVMHKVVETAIAKLDAVGLYQKLMVAYLFLISGFINCMLMGPTLTFMNPLFSCTFAPDLVDESQACPRIEECFVSSDFTIVARLSLYCEGQVDRNLIQSMSSVGSVVGLLVVNFYSDTQGKKKAMLMTLLIGMFSTALTVAGASLQTVWVLVIAQFLNGFCGYSMLILAYIYPSEFTHKEFKQKTLIIINYAWSLTSMMLGLLFYLEVPWDHYLVLYVFLPMGGVALLSLYFLQEGPNFLYRTRRTQEYLSVLHTIAIYNDRLQQYHEIEQNFEFDAEEEKQEDVGKALRVVWADGHFRKIMLILVSTEVGGNLYYIATNYALDEIGYDYGANMIATGAIELLAFLVLQFKIDAMPRKKGIFLLYSLISVLGMLFFIPFMVSSRIASFAVVSIIRFLSTMAYALVLMILTEVFPLAVQGICAGVIESVAQLGVFLGPIIITACIDLQVYPVIVLSFIVVATIVVPIRLLDEKKPEQIEESLIQDEPKE